MPGSDVDVGCEQQQSNDLVMRYSRTQDGENIRVVEGRRKTTGAAPEDVSNRRDADVRCCAAKRRF